MADINDVKSKLITMLASSEQKEKKISDSTSIVCVFRLDSFQEVEVIGEALKKNYVVLLDLSACDDENKQRRLLENKMTTRKRNPNHIL